MIPLETTILGKEQTIQNLIRQRKEQLINVLNNSIDSFTNDFFDFDRNKDYSLTFLCKEATRVQSVIYNVAVFPPEPNILTGNNLIAKELNIQNKIQYCNNLLRYSLKKNGISFDSDLNVMEELIRQIGLINSVKIYDGYISDINLDSNGDLDVTYIPIEDVPASNVVKSISYDSIDENILIDSGMYNNNYSDLYIDLRLNKNRNLKYTQVKDLED